MTNIGYGTEKVKFKQEGLKNGKFADLLTNHR
jgi:hypothetical protein